MVVLVSANGPMGGEIPPNITLASLQESLLVLLGCAGLLFVALLVLGLVLRKEMGRLWQRKLVIYVTTMSLLALISSEQAWSACQSLAHYGLPPDAGYLDWHMAFGQDVADQLDSAVTGFGTFSFVFSIITFALLCVVAEQIVTSLRARRRASR